MHTRQLVFLLLLFISSVHAISVKLSLPKVPDDVYIIHGRYIVSWTVELEPGEDKGDGKLFIVKQSGKYGLANDPIEASFNQSLTGEGSFAFGGVGPYNLVAFRMRVGELSYANRVGEIGDIKVIGRTSTTAGDGAASSSTPTSSPKPTSSITSPQLDADIDTDRDSQPKPRSKRRTAIIVGAVLGSIILILLGLLLWLWRRSRALAARVGDLESQLSKSNPNLNRSFSSSTSIPAPTTPHPAATFFTSNNNASQPETTITAFPYYLPPPRYDSGVDGRMAGKRSLREHMRIPSNGSGSSGNETLTNGMNTSNVATDTNASKSSLTLRYL